MTCSTSTPPAFAISYSAGRRRHVDAPACTCASNSSNLSGPVVERARQPEAVLDERLLARAVAAVHRADLRDGLVRLVEDHQEVFGEVVDERRRRLAGLPVREVARVVLDAVAEAHLLHHLEVVLGPLLEPLLLEEASPPCRRTSSRSRSSSRMLVDRLAHLLLRRDVVRPGVDARSARPTPSPCRGEDRPP